MTNDDHAKISPQIHRVSRRQLIRCAAGAVPLSTALAVAAPATVNKKPTPVVDTHLHCFGGVDPRFPYHAPSDTRF